MLPDDATACVVATGSIAEKLVGKPQIVCQECGNEELKVVEMKKEGEIKTFTIIYIAPSGLESEAPYTVCEVETAEGPWIIGRLDLDAEKVSPDIIGEKVRISYQDLPAERHYPDKERRVVPLFRLME